MAPNGAPAKPPSRLCGERRGSRPNESPKPGPPGRRPSGGLGRGGTAERASFRRRRKRVSVARADVAGMAGLEPANAGVKVPCLTTWLHPNVEVRRGPERTLRPSASYGVGNGARTHDTRNHNPVLCQLSYTHHMKLTADGDGTIRAAAMDRHLSLGRGPSFALRANDRSGSLRLPWHA